MKTITVAKDGTKEFLTIAEAIREASHYAEEPVTIEIGGGVYEEKLTLVQNQVTLIGVGETETVITYGDYGLFLMPDGEKRGTFRTQTFFVDGDDFTAKNITFVNSAGDGRKVGQALALYVDGDRQTFLNCRFLGHQDTLFTAPLPPSAIEKNGFRGPKQDAPRRDSRQYYKRCYLEGDVDFIFGGATAFFEECQIHSLNRGEEVNGYVTAASTPEGKEFGYVFSHCRFTSDCAPETVYLGRPWRNFAKVVVLHCELGAHIKREGWHDWKKEEARSTVFFAEYKNTGAGADTKERAPFARQLTKQEAERYTKEAVLGEW